MRLGGLRLRLPLRHTRYREALRANNAKAHCAYHGRLRQHPGPNYSAKPLHHHSASQDECLACRRHAKFKNHRIFIPTQQCTLSTPNLSRSLLAVGAKHVQVLLFNVLTGSPPRSISLAPPGKIPTQRKLPKPTSPKKPHHHS